MSDARRAVARRRAMRAFLLPAIMFAAGSVTAADTSPPAIPLDGIVSLDACRTRPAADELTPLIRPTWPPAEEVKTAERWVQAPSMIDAHRALRARVGLPMPPGKTQVLVFWHSAHWVAVEESLVATRGSDGRWEIDKVRQWNVGTGSEDETITHVRMSRLDGLALDEYLNDPCLLAEPDQSEWSRVSSSESPHWTIEFWGVAENRSLSRAEDGFGISERIYELIS